MNALPENGTSAIRFYVTDPQEAKSKVKEILESIKSGIFEPLITLDLETMPIKGLEGYPRRKKNDEEDETEEASWPGKRELREYFIKVLSENYSLEALEAIGVMLPRSKPKRKGLPAEIAYQGKSANTQWANLRNALNVIWNDPLLESCRTSSVLPDDLLKHILDVVEDGRQKVDPVQPGLDPFTSDIFTIQLTFQDNQSKDLVTYVFNCNYVDPKVIVPIFNLPKVLFIGANLKFDLKFLIHHTGVAPFNVFCTRVASKILDLGLSRSHSLAATTKRYLGIGLNKETRKEFIGKRLDHLTPEQLEYAATDTEILFPLYYRMMEVIKERDQEEVVQTFCLQSLIYATWETEGYNIDQTAWQNIAAEVIRRRDKVAAELELMLKPDNYEEILGSDDEKDDIEVSDDEEEDTRANALIKISQRALVASLLSKKLGFEVTSLSKDARGAWEAQYRSEHNGVTHPFFNAYTIWSKLAKQASTYGAKFEWNIHPITGKIHPTITIAGTETGRPTSRRPNLLNIPAKKEEEDVDFRSAFIAPPGYVFGDCDYSDIEGRIASDLSQEPIKVKQYAAGIDGHSLTAALIFHLRRDGVTAPTEVVEDFKSGTSVYKIKVLLVPRATTDEEYFAFASSEQVIGYVIKPTRTVAKTLWFLFLYGGGAYTLATRTGFPTRQSEEIWAIFTETFKVLAANAEVLGKFPFDHYREEAEESGYTRRYGYAVAYCNIRRYIELPRNPTRRDFAPTFAGQQAFDRAGKDYNKRKGTVSRAGKNHPMQGGNAVITSEALINLWLMGKHYGIQPYLNIYDEILVKVPVRVSEKFANSMIAEAMIAPTRRYLKTIECPAVPDPLSTCWKKG